MSIRVSTVGGVADRQPDLTSSFGLPLSLWKVANGKDFASGIQEAPPFLVGAKLRVDIYGIRWREESGYTRTQTFAYSVERVWDRVPLATNTSASPWVSLRGRVGDWFNVSAPASPDCHICLVPAPRRTGQSLVGRTPSDPRWQRCQVEFDGNQNDLGAVIGVDNYMGVDTDLLADIYFRPPIWGDFYTGAWNVTTVRIPGGLLFFHPYPYYPTPRSSHYSNFEQRNLALEGYTSLDFRAGMGAGRQIVWTDVDPDYSLNAWDFSDVVTTYAFDFVRAP